MDHAVRKICALGKVVAKRPIIGQDTVGILASEGFFQVDGPIRRCGNMRYAVDKESGVFYLEISKNVLAPAEGCLQYLFFFPTAKCVKKTVETLQVVFCKPCGFRILQTLRTKPLEGGNVVRR